MGSLVHGAGGDLPAVRSESNEQPLGGKSVWRKAHARAATADQAADDLVGQTQVNENAIGSHASEAFTQIREQRFDAVLSAR